MVGLPSREENVMTASRAMGLSAAPMSHILGRKLDSIPFGAYRIVLIVVLGFVRFLKSDDLALSGSLLQAQSGISREHDRHCTKPRSSTITIFQRASP